MVFAKLIPPATLRASADKLVRRVAPDVALSKAISSQRITKACLVVAHVVCVVLTSRCDVVCASLRNTSERLKRIDQPVVCSVVLC